ncbi:hypothetical protein AAFC00_005603 [Neodothiora populina]|uniref:Terpene synthase n=1 Tax=Neodothiora populina TaxID=2781224 RepID=A0ABR3PLR2_9PEZI
MYTSPTLYESPAFYRGPQTDQYRESSLQPYGRENVLSRSRGQKVRIPDLRPLMSGWPMDINPHRETVKAVIADILDKYSMSAAMTMKLKKANLDYLLSVWFPYSSEEKLIDLTYFCGWMFLVDDEIDAMSMPNHFDQDAFAALYRETLEVVQQSLKLGDTAHAEDRKSVSPTAESFRRIGSALCRSYSYEKRVMFLDEARLTLDGYRSEQQLRLIGTIPSFEEYWDYREGSSCCRQVVAMIEFANELRIPIHIIESPDMRSLWKETCLVHWITNDIVSAKKELAEGFVENLVVLCSDLAYSAQSGMDTAINLLKASIQRLELAAFNLLSTYCGQTERRSISQLLSMLKEIPADVEYTQDDLSCAIELFIANCKCMCVGNLNWSVASPRYGLQELSRDEEGGMEFVIGL